MKLKKIADNVAFQTIGYYIGGKTNVNIYVRECGHFKRDIYKGLYKDFPMGDQSTYAYNRVTELHAMENVLCIGIEE